MIFQGGRLKKKSTEIFHTAQRGAGMSPVRVDELAQGCRPLGLPGCGLLAGWALRAEQQSTRGRGVGAGAQSSPWTRQDSTEHRPRPRRPPRSAAPPEGTGVRWVQLRLQAETGLTFNPELLDCLAPLPLVSLLSVFWLLEQFTQRGFL